MSMITTTGPDLAKNVIQIHRADSVGWAELRKKLQRTQLSEFFSQLPSCMIEVEACDGALLQGCEIGESRNYRWEVSHLGLRWRQNASR